MSYALTRQSDFKKAVAVFAIASLFAGAFMLSVVVKPARAASQIYVNIAMPDDTGDGLTPATAKRTIYAGVELAVDGDTVNVAAGTYPENVSIGKSISLVGAGSSSVTVAAFNPFVDALVITAHDVSVSGFTFSGANASNTVAGIHLSGAENCNVFDNVLSNNRLGIWLLGAANNTLTGNLAHNNDIGYFLGNSTHNALTGNTADTNGIGFRLQLSSNSNTFIGTTSTNNLDGIDLLHSSSNTFMTSTVSGNQTGIYLTNSADDNTFSYSDISGNTGWGIYSNNDVTAVKNWWGAASGPTNATNNPGGTGDDVTDNVIFIPWLDNPFATPPTITSINLVEGQTVSGIYTINVVAGWFVNGLPLDDLTQVDFYIDGVLKGTDTKPPYSYDWDTTVHASPHTVRVVATDVLGITGEVTVGVNVLATLPFTGN